ncbi:Lacal_2735 family protein [Mangrovimonas sp. AS39]|uniref:Lacal_2735 family protein n=1 Tax=Mangrovimonas TaxID=1211036 RepID=UPI0006B64461|nr:MULTISPECIES: Lacal_2735 family protein [Mangrovimonas]MCF1191485.1 Lacal_2735 family protein [Mangrovimonas futianensis]MCF1195180.1 Lacal_2735 family protein [Mangrovimonas futianensis]MCF1421142.1 Lacal_2735 family protein [Mangrovimonas futianensis]NIK92278.1 Lacal_2735 family protein [Mangrovimonas sp. CR14]
MKNLTKIRTTQSRLLKRYKQLMEQAYNFRETDSALSDISEYDAIKLLNKINRLKYLHIDEVTSIPPPLNN